MASTMVVDFITLNIDGNQFGDFAFRVGPDQYLLHPAIRVALAGFDSRRHR